MTFLLTLLFTFLLVSIALLVFWKLGPPVYRLERRNVIRLLEMVLDGSATDADWDVFTGVPIHYDPELADVQRRCIAIAEGDQGASKGRLFSSQGCEEIAAIVAELKAAEALKQKPDK